MTGVPLVVLDACVLANFSLCDTLLRLAEPPRIFEPKWSAEIIRETTRTLELKLGWPRMTNDQKDRHVVAAAVHGQAPVILTFNLRHFGLEHLEPWAIRPVHPQTFLIDIFRQEEALVLTKLQQQATDRSRNRARFHSVGFRNKTLTSGLPVNSEELSRSSTYAESAAAFPDARRG
jgi:hypothetical protein